MTSLQRCCLELTGTTQTRVSQAIAEMDFWVVGANYEQKDQRAGLKARGIE